MLQTSDVDGGHQHQGGCLSSSSIAKDWKWSAYPAKMMLLLPETSTVSKAEFCSEGNRQVG